MISRTALILIAAIMLLVAIGFLFHLYGWRLPVLLILMFWSNNIIQDMKRKK